MGPVADPAAALPPFHRTEIDGLRVHWYDGPAPHMAALLFRVGVVDERLPSRGITHIVEHLAMAGLEDAPYDKNASVDHTSTVFHCRGSLEQVQSFLDHVARQLQDLPTHLLDAERRILAAEASSRSPGVMDIAFGLRFGARGYGMLEFDEFGISGMDIDSIRAWARARFATEDAVLLLTTDPARLRLPRLAAGHAHAVPRPDPLDIVTPTLYGGGPGGLALSVLGARTPTLSMGWEIAQRRAVRRLRHQDAIAYAVDDIYLPLGPEAAHAMLIVTCEDQRTGAAFGALQATLDGLATDGATAEELDSVIGRRRTDLADPLVWPDILGNLSSLDLDGSPINDVAALVASWGEVTAEGIGTAVGAALSTAILLSDLPDPDPRYGRYPEGPQVGRMLGRRLPSLSAKPPHVLVQSTDGIAIEHDDRPVTAVRFDGCELVLTDPGRRFLVGRDGSRLDVWASAWKDGAQVIAAIDRSIPPNRFVILPAEGLTLPLARPPGSFARSMES